MRLVFLFAIATLLGRAESLRIEPRDIHLAGPGASQRFVVTFTSADGIDHDVTALTKAKALDPAISVVSDSDALLGRKPGKARVRAEYRGATAQITVQVGEKASTLEVSFDPDILSILTTKGCNSSGCHGAIAGKNGFKLSLFGYDAAADHEMISRRVDLAKPDESLLLRKPSVAISHGGGNVLPPDSHDYRTMLQWLRQGAKLNSTGPRITRLEMSPSERTILASDGPQRVVTMARLSDGTTRDMTSEVRYEASAETVVKLSAPGEFRPTGPGLATILARAMGKAATSQVGVIPSAAGPDFPQTTANNFVDELVFAKLRSMNLRPTGLATDEEFLRRAYVDTLGRVPLPEERRAFLAHRNRARLIDELLEHPEHVSYRTVKFEDWFRNTQLYSQGRPMGTYGIPIKELFA